MDKGLLIRELASNLGVTEDTVINWEVRGRKPVGKNRDNVLEFIRKGADNHGKERQERTEVNSAVAYSS